MWVQSKLSPTPTDPIQAKVMQIMPFAFSIFFFFFPAGLVLYSLCNNILSIAQQWQITRMYENKANDSNKDKKKIKNKPEPADENLRLAVPADDAENSKTSAESVDVIESSGQERQSNPQPRAAIASNKAKVPGKARNTASSSRKSKKK